MTTIDIGNGKTAQRHHLTKAVLGEFDQATAALSQAQANVRAWVRPLLAMQTAAGFSGDVSCNAPNQSGRTYTLSEIGGAMLVDERDLGAFSKIGATAVLSGSAPSTGLRSGLVILDASVNELMRFDGSTWAPVALQ
jgi:hypothetical protein